MTARFDTYNYFDSTGNEVIAIELMEGPLVGTIFSFGKVEVPNPDVSILNFEYTVHHGILLDKDDTDNGLIEFRKYLGEILISIIEESINGDLDE